MSVCVALVRPYTERNHHDNDPCLHKNDSHPPFTFLLNFAKVVYILREILFDFIELFGESSLLGMNYSTRNGIPYVVVVRP